MVPWYGYIASKGDTAGSKSTKSFGFIEALKDPNVRAALGKQPLQAMDPMTSEELQALVLADTEKDAGIIKDASIKLGD